MLDYPQLIEQYHNQTRQNPPKEIQLLTAIKPFVHPQNHQTLDAMIEILQLAETLKNIQKSFI